MSKVYLVGAGPGDPGLITVKGRSLLEAAEVILYDHLANPVLLDLAPPDAERIYVGKKRAVHAHSQEEIIAMMVERARQGKMVVRLKGGDPFIFGRGGEEVEGLAAAGIDFEVVPGVTSPLGIAAYTGVPLTHREHTSVVTFVTGHDVDAIEWHNTGLSDTLVIFMGLEHLPEIARRLIAVGRPPDTPAMAVRWGTRPEQKTVAGSLSNLPRLVAEADLKPPVTIIVGEVVRLRDRLDWFDRKPLRGQTVVITRAQSQAAELSSRLLDLGACVVALPVIELAPLEDYEVLDHCIERLESYDWLIFTSANAVEYFLARLKARGRDVRAIRGSLCAIGPATRGALEAAHLHIDLMPDEHVAEGAVAAFAKLDMRGKKVLLPRAAEGREVLPKALAAAGAHVDVAETYRNAIPPCASEQVAAFLARGVRPDWITFTSGSTVTNWIALAGRGSLEGVRIASIGPATSQVARNHGLSIDAEAQPFTVDGLVAALLRASTRSLAR